MRTFADLKRRTLVVTATDITRGRLLRLPPDRLNERLVTTAIHGHDR